MKGPLYPYKNIWPQLDGQVYLAPGARIIGDVTIGHGSSVWFNSVIRGDDSPIRIGSFTNIQDGSVIHVQEGGRSTHIGDCVTIGHNVIIHACTIGSNCLIGMGAIILTGAVIGDNCIIGAGALIPEERHIPAGSLAVGAPGRILRQLTAEQIADIRESARLYHQKAFAYSGE